MEYTCKNCGNVFGDYLTGCPSCGTAIDSVAEETKAVDEEPEVLPRTETEQQSDSQPSENQQQPYQQQPFQQQPFQQQSYQQQPFQQPYQQNGYQNASGYNYNPNATYQAGAPVYNPNMPVQPKSRLAAGLLGIFLGGLGVHNFYLGFTSKAVIQILVSFITCGLGSIWGFIEGIMIIAGSINTDADGIPLGE